MQKIRPPRVTTPSPYESPEAMEDAIAARLAKAKAEREEREAKAAARREADPSVLRQLIPIGVVVAGSAAVIAAGTAFGGPLRSISEDVRSFFRSNQVENELKQPVGQVRADIRSGEIGPDEARRVIIDDSGTAWSAAEAVTGPGEPTEPIADIISAQQGNTVRAGQRVFLPPDAIDLPPDTPRPEAQ